MNKLAIITYQDYMKNIYKSHQGDQGLFMKLVEEVGEVAQVLNIKEGRKQADINIDEALSQELADIIHYAFAIASINNIDLESVILEKNKSASLKYGRTENLINYIQKEKTK
ncbi:MazG nucleotide pyrophosphohydrolase domain-containing protein [Streptococcus parauberis]|uniref:MazG nucleotide pyrophosphohydrolase domain-containing protein n=1 Tax=Streptococcus parauberis TaxID=1348 RepID=UPI000789B4EA|nr:MazG nucleotide pyrophosphohydrolase domain-containing protein [Streptococcus parauberis]KYP16965.1 MazG nucleotide pyrophosphohydrolase domain protein [Streptococcus parauberis]KYP18236.1 MazG nucleotide pyrophosphohydrolase domain protein [Streptococcus parauberis]KYP20445.1 MazG nucleotide pyrophosphohydrolase domain protein [Streptococcus parauberis]KYP24715.1 MazG nucleotide pyrophosphohydrolase domain protein [Streptococcus parauberis]KYP27094.1 MazG nucleotide pyrophosphohydrolase do